MIKRNPSRNQRSKGVKVKHVLQVVLLLGVCFWLIYQVKHNHDKKKEFDKNDSKLSSVGTETDQIIKLGRKDLLPGKDEVNQNEKHEEEEEEDEHIVDDADNKHEHDKQEEGGGNKHETEENEDNVHEGKEREEEENKHEAEEDQEEDENKSEEVEDEGGDVETDENDHEKSDVDNDHDDEVIDEETENEDKEDEEKGGLVENHDNHEAREEQYKGDDASSAVAHDSQSTSTETETINLEHSHVILQTNIQKPENETTYSDESNRNQSDSELKVTEGEVTDAISSNATAKTNTDSHLDGSTNLTSVITEASSNLTSTGNNTLISSEQNRTEILSESDHAQNATVNSTITGDIKQTEGLEQSGYKISDGNLPANDSTVSVKSENGNTAPEESSTLEASALEKTIGFLASNGTENISTNLDINVSSNTTESDKSKGSTETSEANETNIDANEDEMFKGDTQTGETDEKSDSSSVTNELLDSVVNDAIDSSDTHNIHEDMAKARTDLDTLPDIRSEGNDSDEIAAE